MATEKKYMEALLSLITGIINTSLAESVVPSKFKIAKKEES